MSKRTSEVDLLISQYRKKIKELEQQKEHRRAVIYSDSENEDLGQSSDGTLTPNQVEKEEKRLEREAKPVEARKLERLQKEDKDKLKEQKAKERKDKKRLEKERPDAGAMPGLPIAPLYRPDLGQSPDGTPTPNQIEKEKEARKLKRLQKKEENDKLKEQKAKEREDKRMAPLALQDSKRLEKERPDAGAVPGFQVAPLYPPEIPAHLDPTIIVDDTLVATENMEIPVDIELPQDTPISTDESLHQAATDTNLELDPEMRLALGDPAEDTPIYGENIHADLAQRWEPLLRKGLTKEIKEKISKEHNVPDNCRLLKAPSLNSEIAAIVAFGVRAADSRIERNHSQLGLGITAISKAMSTLINDGKKVDVIKLLQEGCRLLCDLHYAETQTRIKIIKRHLEKSFINIIHDERDDTLFGKKLSIEKPPNRVRQSGNRTNPPRQAGPQVRQQSVRGRSPTRH